MGKTINDDYCRVLETIVDDTIDYLIIGDRLEDGRLVSEGQKYIKAEKLMKKKRISIMKELAFENFCKTKFEDQTFKLVKFKPFFGKLPRKEGMKEPG